MKDLKDYNIKINCPSKDEIIDFAKESSKLTRMTLKLLISGIHYNNIWVIANPNSELRIIPILTYLFKENFNKDILILSDRIKNKNYRKKIKSHIDRFKKIQIGNISIKEEIVPLIKSFNRESFYESGFKMGYDFSYLNSNNLSKILFSSDLYDLSIDRLKKEKYYGRNSISLNVLNINIGLIILENIDIFSDVYYDTLLELLKPLIRKKLKILIHFSNPFSKYISRLEKDLGANILLYDSSFFLRNKDTLYNSSWNTKKSLISDYELDNKYSYSLNYKIIDNLDPGNVDYYFEEFLRLKEYSKGKLQDEILLHLINQRFDELYNTALHPNDYTFSFFLNDFYPNSSIDEFIEIAKKEYESVSDEENILIENLLTTLYSFYLELKNTKRYSDIKSFNKESKNYFLLSYLKEQDIQENTQKQFTILSQNAFERKKVRQDIHDLQLQHIFLDNILITTMQDFTVAHEDEVIYPGCPKTIKELSILLNNSKELLFITYKGINNSMLQKQLKELKNKEFNVERKNYFIKIFKQLELSTKLIPPFLDIQNLDEKTPIEIEVEKFPIVDKRSPDKEIKQKNDVRIRFVELKSKKRKIKSFYSHQRLIIYNKDVNSELREVKYLKKGDLVLDIDGKRSVLEIMCEIYELNSKVDLDSILEYYNKLSSHFTLFKLTLQEFYNRYVSFTEKPKGISEFRHWIKQAIIGPEMSQDIKAIGEALNDDYLIENYEYIYSQIERIRINHIKMGRKLKRIVEKVLDKKDINSFEELLILNHLSFFEIREITKL
jgi:hypothetical protein